LRRVHEAVHAIDYLMRWADEEVSPGWLAERLREFVDASPEYGAAIGRLASWLARLDDEG